MHKTLGLLLVSLLLSSCGGGSSSPDPGRTIFEIYTGSTEAANLDHATAASEFAVLLRDAGYLRATDDPFEKSILDKVFVGMAANAKAKTPTALLSEKRKSRIQTTETVACDTGDLVLNYTAKDNGDLDATFEYRDCVVSGVLQQGRIRYIGKGLSILQEYAAQEMRYTEYRIAGAGVDYLTHGTVAYSHGEQDHHVLLNLVINDQLQQKSVLFDQLWVGSDSVWDKPTYFMKGRLYLSAYGYVDAHWAGDGSNYTHFKYLQMVGDQSQARLGWQQPSGNMIQYDSKRASGSTIELDANNDGVFERSNFIGAADVISPGSTEVLPHMMQVRGEGEIGKSLTLSALMSQHTGGKLAQVSWAITSAPDSSTATITPVGGGTTASLVPDVPGQYKIRLVLDYDDAQVVRNYAIYAFRRTVLPDFAVTANIQMQINPDNDAVIIYSRPTNEDPRIHRISASSGAISILKLSDWYHYGNHSGDISDNGRYVVVHAPAPDFSGALAETRVIDTSTLSVTQSIRFEAWAPLGPQVPLVTNRGQVFMGTLCRLDFDNRRLVDLDTGDAHVASCAADEYYKFGAASQDGNRIVGFDLVYDVSQPSAVRTSWSRPAMSGCFTSPDHINATSATVIWCDEIRRLSDGSIAGTFARPGGASTEGEIRIVHAGNYTTLAAPGWPYVVIAHTQTGLSTEVMQLEKSAIIAAADSSGKRLAVLQFGESGPELLTYF